MTRPRIASLGMYDRPELHGANDALWAGIADHLGKAGIRQVPPALERGRSLPAIWDEPGLLLAQCCGYPLATRWRGRLRYVATPRYRAPGCEGIGYRSRIVVRAGDRAESLSDLRGRRAAINEWSSNSGMNLLRAMIAPIAGATRFFADVVETGSHAASARAIAEGEADVAAIDTIAFAHLERHDATLAHRLRTIGWTMAAPGLPIVTGVETTAGEVKALRAALRAVTTDPAFTAARALLLIDDFEVARPARYEAVLHIEAKAAQAGYPVLA